MATRQRALIQLRPLENAEYAPIVEEHIRYWQKRKDDKAAQDEANRLRKAKMAADIAKERGQRYDKLLEDMTLGDSQGYFRDQIVSSFEEARPQLAALQRDYIENGNVSAYLEYQQKMQGFRELVGLDKVAAETATSVSEQAGNFNPLYDTPKVEMLDRFNRGIYRVNGTNVEFPDSETGEIVSIPAGEMAGRMRGYGSFTGNIDFNSLGSDLSSEIKLKDVNGNRSVSNAIKRAGLAKAKNMFQNNRAAMDTFAYNNGFTREQIESGYLLTPEGAEDFEDLSARFYNEQIVPALQERDNSLANSSLMLSMRSRKEKLKPTSLLLSTTESGELLKQIKPEELKGIPWDASTDGYVFSLRGGLNVPVPGASNEEMVYDNLIYQPETGNVIATGRKVRVNYNDEGERIGQNFVDNFVEGGDVALNNIAGSINLSEGVLADNLEDIYNEMELQIRNKQAENEQRKQDGPQASNSILNPGDSAPSSEPARETNTDTSTKVRVNWATD